MVVVLVTPLQLALNVTGVDEPTGCVVMLKIAVVAPCTTVTLAGTCAAPRLSLARVTTIPPAGAAEPRETVPVEPTPPVTTVGLASTLDNTGGLIVRLLVTTLPAQLAVMVAFVAPATAVVVITNSILLAPSGTLTVAGT